MSQLQHQDVSFKQQLFPLILILDGLSSPANIGGIFRLADAFGVEKIILHKCDFNLSSNRFKRTARQTQNAVIFEIQDVLNLIVSDLSQSGYRLFALEISTQSIPLQNISIETDSNIALVIGNEKAGVSEDFLKHSEKHLHIPMFGKNSSMNVAQATGIALFEIARNLNFQ